MNPLPVCSVRDARKGFSLVELLVVISIIVIILTFTIPATTGLFRGSLLTQGSQMLGDQFALARQMALTRNHPVELRFFKFSDPEVPGEGTDIEGGKYRAFQCFEVLHNGVYVPVGKFQMLPMTVIISEGQLSSIISSAPNGPVKGSADPTSPVLPRKIERNYQYVAFRFMPDGSTDLPLNGASAGNWFMTLHGIDLGASPTNARAKGGGTINYFTIQIDPVTGTSRTFRPTAG